MEQLRLYGIQNAAGEAITVLQELGAAAEHFEEPRRRRHELWVLTCYLDGDLHALKRLVTVVKAHLRLASVRLVFNYAEALRLNPSRIQEQLVAYQHELNGGEVPTTFEWVPARVGTQLLHAKSYALVQRDNAEGAIQQSFLIITSGNLTSPGLGIAKLPNVEIGYQSDKIGDARQFEHLLSELGEYRQDLASSALKHETYLFKYALLASGTYIHKWQGTLSGEVRITYHLTAKGKLEARPTNEEIRQRGFNVESDSLGQTYVGLERRPAHPFPKHFRTSYAIETHMGHWCPNTVWNRVKEYLKGDDDALYKWFRDATTETKLNEAAREAERQEAWLLKQGFIVADKDRIARWRKKMNLLREDRDRLRRLHWQFEDYELPFRPEDRREVEALYDSLESSLRLKRNGSIAADLAARAIEDRSLSALVLNDRQETRLRSVFDEAPTAADAE